MGQDPSRTSPEGRIRLGERTVGGGLTVSVLPRPGTRPDPPAPVTGGRTPPYPPTIFRPGPSPSRAGAPGRGGGRGTTTSPTRARVTLWGRRSPSTRTRHGATLACPGRPPGGTGPSTSAGRPSSLTTRRRCPPRPTRDRLGTRGKRPYDPHDSPGWERRSLVSGLPHPEAVFGSLCCRASLSGFLPSLLSLSGTDIRFRRGRRETVDASNGVDSEGGVG